MSYPMGPETPDDFWGIGDITRMQDVTPPGGGGSIRNAAELLRGNFLLNILGGFLNVGQAIGSLLDELSDAFKGLYEGDDPRLRDFMDGQLALNKAVGYLSPLLDYGSAYMRTSPTMSGIGRVWFSEQVGPMQGCEIVEGMIRLDERGLWDIQSQIWASWLLGTSHTIEWEIRVLKPDRTIYSLQAATVTTGQLNEQSLPLFTSVVIPDAGYFAEIWVTKNAGNREIKGGSARSRLTVKHISLDTTTGNTGQ